MTPAGSKTRDGVTWLIAAFIAITLTFAGLAAWLAIQRDQARDQLDHTDWVQVCRTIHPEDLDR